MDAVLQEHSYRGRLPKKREGPNGSAAREGTEPAARRLPRKQSPAPDDLSGEFYQMFGQELTPITSQTLQKYINKREDTFQHVVGGQYTRTPTHSPGLAAQSKGAHEADGHKDRPQSEQHTGRAHGAPWPPRPRPGTQRRGDLEGGELGGKRTRVQTRRKRRV